MPSIAVFITCLTDQFFPRAGIAMVKVLEHLGDEVVFPEAQTCCGQPLHNDGHRGAARDLARRMVEVFRPYETIVTPSGSCAAMVREHVPALLEDDPARDDAAALAGRTFEFVEHLERRGIDLGALGVRWSGAVACHVACHGVALGLDRVIPRALERIEGLERVPLPTDGQCCGFGGSFSIRHASVAAALGADKVADLRANGVRTLVCGDAGCAMSIGGACHRAGWMPRIVSVAEIIAEGLGLLPREPDP